MILRERPSRNESSSPAASRSIQMRMADIEQVFRATWAYNQSLTILGSGVGSFQNRTASEMRTDASVLKRTHRPRLDFQISKS